MVQQRFVAELSTHTSGTYIILAPHYGAPAQSGGDRPLLRDMRPLSRAPDPGCYTRSSQAGGTAAAGYAPLMHKSLFVDWQRSKVSMGDGLIMMMLMREQVMPCGGGTPLAQGLVSAMQVASTARKRGDVGAYAHSAFPYSCCLMLPALPCFDTRNPFTCYINAE